MTIVSQPTPDVDALDVDAPAAAQLAKDAGDRARVVRTGGCTYICFADRGDFLAACAERLIELTNPFDIKTQGRNVYAPVLFGKDGQWRWEAMAVFPAQNPCDCGAEVLHRLGCSSIEYPVPAMFADIPVLVIDVPRHIPVAGIVTHFPVLSGYGSMCGKHPDSLTRNPDRVTCPDCAVMLPTPEDLPRRIPGATTSVHYTPRVLRRQCPATGPNVLATTERDKVTCPSCLLALVPPYGPEHAALAEALVVDTSGAQR